MYHMNSNKLIIYHQNLNCIILSSQFGCVHVVAKLVNFYYECTRTLYIQYSGSLDVRPCDLFTFSVSSSDFHNRVHWKRLFIKC